MDLNEQIRECDAIYSALCSRLGDLEFKKSILLTQINKIKQQMAEINTKSGQLKERLNATK